MKKQILEFQPSNKQRQFFNDERKYIMITNERRLYPLLIQSAKEEGCALYRIEDAGANKKPFDIGGCWYDGRAAAIEVKLSTTNNPHQIEKPPLHLMSTHQMEWLQNFAQRNGIALFVIYLSNFNTWLVWRLQAQQDGLQWVPFQFDTLEGWTTQIEQEAQEETTA